MSGERETAATHATHLSLSAKAVLVSGGFLLVAIRKSIRHPKHHEDNAGFLPPTLPRRPSEWETPPPRAIERGAEQKNFLFLLEEKTGGAQNQKL